MKQFLSKTLFIAALGSILILPTGCSWLPESLGNLTNFRSIKRDLSAEEIQKLAKNITVKIFNSSERGSGVIISKDGETYTVVTNAHVIRNKKTYQIQTPDGKNYDAKIISRGNFLEGNDLAILEFSAREDYQVIPLAVNPNIEKDKPVYTAGFPQEIETLVINPGKISLIATKPFTGGYKIGYTNEVKFGMSGGPLLNQKGELIGINGLLSHPILDTAYNYQDGTKPSQEKIELFRESNFAVPIKTLVAVAPNLAAIPKEWKAGVTIAEKVDNIAREITVRIDRQNKVDGSGAIIARDGETYYVVTARHVVKNKDKDSYQIVTPDGNKYNLKPSDILTAENFDAAIIKFKSSKKYQVATLARYELNAGKNQWVFLSGFPGALNGTRKFTSGFRFNRDRGLNLTIDNASLNINNSGYELIYTNLTKPGMSGGPVLDANGQLIGINGGFEGEYLNLKDTIQIGYAFGVPESIFLGLTTKKGITNNLLNVTNSAPKELTETEIITLKNHDSFAVEKPPSDANAAAWLNYGNQLWRLQKFDEAIIALEKAIKLDPDLYQAYYALGLVYYSQGENEKALEQFDRTIELRPGYYQAWRDKSKALYNLEKYSEALNTIDRAIFWEENDFNLYWWRGQILHQLARFDEAIQAYSKLIEIRPNYAVYVQRAWMYYLTEDYQKALADFDRVIELQPENPTFYSSRGVTFRKLRDYRKAFADFTKAIELDPNNPEYYYQRAIDYFLTQPPQKAIPDFNKAISLDPSNAEYYSARGNAYSAMGNHQAALADYTRAIKIEQNPTYYINRAGSYIQLNEYKKALADYNSAIEIQPKYASAYVERGFLRTSYFQDDSGAMADLDRAIYLIEKDPETWFYGMNAIGDSPQLRQQWLKDFLLLSSTTTQAYRIRGNLRCKLGKYAGAIEDYDRAISNKPNKGNLYIHRGDCYAKSQQTEKAKADYDRAIELISEEIKIQPQKHSLYNSRARVRKRLQDYQGAIDDYTKALDLVPNDALNYANRAGLRQKLTPPDYQGAIEDYTKAIELQPNNFNRYRGRSVARYRLKDYQGAFEDTSKTIELFPEGLDPNQKANSYITRSSLAFQLDKPDYELIIKDSSEAIKIKPDIQFAYLLRGHAYLIQKDYQKATADFEKAIKLKPDLPNGYVSRGWVHFVRGNYDRAISDFNLALSKDKNYWYATANIGAVKYETGDISEAIKLWQQALKIAKKEDAPLTRLALAVALYKQGDTEQAYSIAEAALKLDKRVGSIDYLQNRILWGKNAIADTKTFFATPKMQALLAEK